MNSLQPEIPVLVIFGTTASGKTSLAGQLFSKAITLKGKSLFPELRGMAEIISADSMQVYRGMDIGTAKPSKDFISSLPHHLIDICNPCEQFSAGDFVRLADEKCIEIFNRGKLPVVLGGTAFYIKHFLYGLPVTPESKPEVRLRFKNRALVEGVSVLYAELCEKDPYSAKVIHPHDEYRIIRALEVLEISGLPRSEHSVSHTLRPGFKFFPIALDRPRKEIFERIDSRVEDMFNEGLLEEWGKLCSLGFSEKDPGMQAIGYREFFLTNPPGSDLEFIKKRIQHNSKKYAKRQETFIKSLPHIQHFGADDLSSIYMAVLDGFSQSVHT